MAAKDGPTPRGSLSRGLGSRSSMSNKQIQGLSVPQVQESLLDLLPEHETFVREHIFSALCNSEDEYRKVQRLLEENLDRGLDAATHDQAPVKMYTSYVREVPDGTEKGNYLALDLGGPNYRVLLIQLEGSETSIDCKHGVISNKILTGNPEQLFDSIASTMHRFLKQKGLLNTPYHLPLGFTFSFPSHQQTLNKTILRTWAKNFHCDGVVDQEVVALLTAAIQRKGDMNIECIAVVSDTVGTLMSGALTDKLCSIGLVLGKGTNACYFEDLQKVGTWTGDQDDPQQMIINTEWHSFGKDGCLDFIRSEYDKDIDTHSKHPGNAIYEKMISGQFIGEVVRLILHKMKDAGVLFEEHWTEELGTRNRLYSKYISEVLGEEDIRFKHTRHVFDDLHVSQASELECRVLHNVCQLVSDRAANLVAVGLATLMNRMGRPEVAIAVDGDMYRFHPLFKDMLIEKIPQFLKEDIKFWFVPASDGSGLGAAVVAAVAERWKHQHKH